METLLNIFVEGHPAPQGSKKMVGRSKTGVPVLVEMCKRHKSWRKTVSDAVKLSFPPILDGQTGEMHVGLCFVMPRPKSMSAKRPTPPHTKRPDQDKLFRSIMDGITDAGLWRDDAQVTKSAVIKRYAEAGEKSGVKIVVLGEAAQ